MNDLGKVFKLSMVERFAVLSVLPKEGSYATLRILRGLEHQLAPSEEEIKEMGMVPMENGMVKMNEKSGEERDMEIGEMGEDLIRNALLKLNREARLVATLFSVYEKFVPKEDR